MPQTSLQGASTDPMRQDVRATLAARRELGPEYDDYFVETLVQRLAHHLVPRRKGARVAVEPVVRTARDPMVASANQRLFLAVLSLAALIFLAIALAASDWGLAGFLLGSGAIGLINLLFAKARWGQHSRRARRNHATSPPGRIHRAGTAPCPFSPTP